MNPPAPSTSHRPGADPTRERMHAALDGELSPAELAELHAALENSASRDEWKSLCAIEESLRAQPQVHPAPDFAARVMASLPQAAPGRAHATAADEFAGAERESARDRRWSPAAVVATLALTAVAIQLGFEWAGIDLFGTQATDAARDTYAAIVGPFAGLADVLSDGASSDWLEVGVSTNPDRSWIALALALGVAALAANAWMLHRSQTPGEGVKRA